MNQIEITREEKIHRTAQLMSNELTLRKIKIFPIQQVEYDSKELPQQAIYKPYQNYIFCTSTIREKQRILHRFSTALIKLNGILYFPLFLPNSRELRSQLIALLEEAEIKKTDRLTITYESKVQARTTGKKKNIPNNWMKKLPMLEEVLNTQISYTVYQPTKNIAKFPLYILEKNVKKFLIYSKNKTCYGFYFKALIYHVALSSGLFGQYSISKVIANVTDIKKLLPCNLPIQKICRENKFVKIEKVKNQLIFNYKMNILNTLHHHITADGKTVKHQRIMLPFKLINHALRAEAFGRNGIPFLLLIVFGYRCKHPKVNYKPSTIVELAKLNTKRGIPYIIESINKPLRYFKNLGLLDFEEVTKESYKADTPVIVELFPFTRVKF